MERCFVTTRRNLKRYDVQVGQRIVRSISGIVEQVQYGLISGDGVLGEGYDWKDEEEEEEYIFHGGEGITRIWANDTNLGIQGGFLNMST